MQGRGGPLLAGALHAVPPDIEAAGPQADALRAATGQALHHLNLQQYCAAGLNFGYYHDASPLIACDGQAAPGYTTHSFTPSTVPGCRTPHVWLADGASLCDAMGNDHAVLRPDPAVDVAPLLAAAALRGMPLRPVELDGSQARAVYHEALVLSRPDQHEAAEAPLCRRTPAACLTRFLAWRHLRQKPPSGAQRVGRWVGNGTPSTSRIRRSAPHADSRRGHTLTRCANPQNKSG